MGIRMPIDAQQDPLTAKQKELIAELFSDLPTEFPASYEAAKEIRQAFHQKLGRALHTSVNDYFASMSQGTVERARDMASELNETLSSLGLGIKCAKTSRPAILIVDTPNNRPDVPRYRIQLSEKGRKTMTTTTSELPFPLEFTPAASRVEGLRRRNRRQHQNSDLDGGIAR